METYLVGGAVRDALLELPVVERDWVVVGARAADLTRQGYRQVGRDFPVFLHPDSGEEYALARTERKTASGHTGFTTDAGPQVTLEEDLQRRDLTINAIAQRPDGSLVDPWGGQADLQQRLLRHVSPAFSEDPLRVLRVARFAARFAHLGFTVAADTNALMQQMVASGELDTLTPERVWQEMAKALVAATPVAFFAVLDACGALSRLFPAFGPLARPGFAALAAATADDPLEVRFAVLWGPDAAVPAGALPKLCRALRAPNACRDLALQMAAQGPDLRRWRQLPADRLLAVLRRVDALRRRDRFGLLLRGLALLDPALGTATDTKGLAEAAAVVAAIPARDLVAQGLAGRDLAEALDQLAVAALESFSAS